MRDVVHVITGLAVGGAESMLTSLLISQRQQGQPQHVISLSRGGANVTRLRDADIRVTELNMQPRNPSAWQLLRLSRLIWRERPRIVQSWMYHADLAATMALIWAGLHGQTRLYWGLRCSDMELSKYGLRLRMVVQACARLSHVPDIIVSNSVSGGEFHRQIGYRPRRLVLIDNGIDTARFRPDQDVRRAVRAELGVAENHPLVAHVARVDPMKDHTSFMQALDWLPNATALAIGQGTENLPDRPGLRRLGRRLDVPRLLAAADLIVSSSAFGEGFSNALSEGMAAGLAPVATDVGDARRIIGDTGIIVPPKNPRALAEAMGRLIEEEPAQKAARRLAARERIVREYSLARAARAFEQLYAE